MHVLSPHDIEELARYAGLAGCTVAQVRHAIECVGGDELAVRAFLESHGHIAPQHPVVFPALVDMPPEPSAAP